MQLWTTLLLKGYVYDVAPMQVRVRDDKDPEQATTAEQVAEMFRAQALQTDKKKGTQAAEDDY